MIKFETKSHSRVTGLSFHCEKSWILACRCSGPLEIWDYEVQTLVHKFYSDDQYPVRSVDFHSSQPIFASAGDDCKIKVWNYNSLSCMFSLLGHLDCIRTVQFHLSCPWIISASNDKTIRIWNWRSQTCVSVLTGHSDVVTCASFHPIMDMVISASLDQTVRVWDIHSMRKNQYLSTQERKKRKNVKDFDVDFQNSKLVKSFEQLNPVGSSSGDGADAVAKYIVQAHDGGVNWVAFDPVAPAFVSCGNDHKVKFWDFKDTRFDLSMERHLNKTSCAIFASTKDKKFVVSCSEDKTICLLDFDSKIFLQIFPRRNDRFSILASHAKTGIVAVGHDSGMMVFKLVIPHPVFCVSGDSLFYVGGKSLHVFDYITGQDSPLVSASAPGTTGSYNYLKYLSYNPSENAMLISSYNESHELCILPKGSCKADSAERKSCEGGSAFFLSQNRFAVLEERSNQVLIKNLDNRTLKTIVLPIATTAISSAGNGKLLCVADDRVFIFDLHKRTVIGDLRASSIKEVVWSVDMESVALYGMDTLIIADKQLRPCCKHSDRLIFRSGTWDDNGVFIYSTYYHLKYCLPNGENGIIKSSKRALWITKVSGSKVFYLDSSTRNCHTLIDSTEYVFKLSLLKNKYDQAMRLVRELTFSPPKAMVAHLQKRGFAQIAQHLVKDDRTCFELALQCGDIQVALASAKEIDGKEHWLRLGMEALGRGNTGIAEYAFQRTKNFARLSFIYLVTGNLEGLYKMMENFETEHDVLCGFHYALCLGNVEERIKILNKSGKLPLAYITASVHRLGDIAELLAKDLGDDTPPLPRRKSAALLIPPKPILCAGDWPMSVVAGGEE